MRRFFTPKWVQRYKEIYRQEGIKGLIKKGGWRLLVILFLYYLIRDSILYILIPYLVAKGLWNVF
ncbi:MAG: hypothetical protein KatS3mg031_0729 [Chitinophagales bacterium]|nr:MAG: hypothetical protein KatS3mg031_0729 [Chitinophagales bacterium]